MRTLVSQLSSFFDIILIMLSKSEVRARVSNFCPFSLVYDPLEEALLWVFPLKLLLSAVGTLVLREYLVYRSVPGDAFLCSKKFLSFSVRVYEVLDVGQVLVQVLEFLETGLLNETLLHV